MTTTEPAGAFHEVEFPLIREGAIDLLREAHRKHMIYMLQEVGTGKEESALRQGSRARFDFLCIPL